MPKVENYGEVLAEGLNLKLLFYCEYGSYQGDYIALLTDGEKIFLYKDSYGSCSGCDWLEGERDRNTSEVSDSKIKEYVRDEKPFLELNQNQVETMVNAKDISVYFPANTRNDYDDWNWENVREILKNALLT